MSLRTSGLITALAFLISGFAGSPPASAQSDSPVSASRLTTRRLVDAFGAKLGRLPDTAPGGSSIQDSLALELPLEGVFSGRRLIYIADSDMEASAYVDGRLGPAAGSDILGVVDLLSGAHWTIPASNSVAGPAVALETSSDGRHAYVVETFGPRSQSAEQFRELSTGDTLRVFGFGNDGRPELVVTRKVARRPEALDLNTDGTLLALAAHRGANEPTEVLALYPVKDGLPGRPTYLNVEAALPGFTRIIDVEFSPDGKVIALADEGTARVAFLRRNRAGGFDPVGNAVRVERTPYMLKWTPDSRHLLVNALYWGDDIEGKFNEVPEGGLLSIRFNAGRYEDGRARHALVSRAMVGPSPESFEVSPDGRMVVTVDMHRSWLPHGDSRLSEFSNLTLLSLDPETGDLAVVDKAAFDGVLPESVVFDRDGDALAVVSFDRFGGFDGRNHGTVAFYRILKDPIVPRTRLVRTTEVIRTPRGIHTMSLHR